MKQLLVTLLLLLTLDAAAQSDKKAEEIMRQAAVSLKKSGSIEARFTLLIEENKTERSSKTEGTLRMQGKQFSVITPERSVWFDGTQQWSYDTGAAEAYLSKLDEEEWKTTNPTLLLNSYQTHAQCTSTAKRTIDGEELIEVVLTPKKKSEEWTSMRLYFLPSNYLFRRCIVANKSKQTTSVILNQIKTGQTLPNALFSFDKKRYPKVEVIDLR